MILEQLEMRIVMDNTLGDVVMPPFELEGIPNVPDMSQSNDLLREMFIRDGLMEPVVKYPYHIEEGFQPSEGTWEYYNRTIGESNSVVPNPGSLF